MPRKLNPPPTPDAYLQVRQEILGASNPQLNVLVARLLYGVTDSRKLVSPPSFLSFSKIMELVSFLRTSGLPVNLWPLSITENLKTVTRERAYVAGLGVHAYEIECGPHGGVTEELFWWETEAQGKFVAYGSSPEIALLRACLLVAARQVTALKVAATSN